MIDEVDYKWVNVGCSGCLLKCRIDDCPRVNDPVSSKHMFLSSVETEFVEGMIGVAQMKRRIWVKFRLKRRG